MTPEEKQLLTIYRALNPDGEETLLRIAKHLQDAQEVQPLLDKVEAHDRARRTQGKKNNVTSLLIWKREHGFQDTKDARKEKNAGKAREKKTPRNPN